VASTPLVGTTPSVTTDGTERQHHHRRRRRRRAADLAGLRPGEHLYALYRDRRQHRRIAAAFVRAGLAAGDQVIYIGADRPDAGRELLEADGIDTRTPCHSGQLVVRSFADVFCGTLPEDPQEVGRALRAAVLRCRGEGFPGLRVAAEMEEFTAAAGSLDRLLRWERMASRLQVQAGVTTVCQYDERRLDGGDAALIAAEHSALAAYAGPQPLAAFLATREPWGLRVLGEVDLSNRPAFLRALRARLAAHPDVRLDLGEVTFMDVGSLRAVFRLAAGLGTGGRIVLANLRPQVRRVVALAQLGEGPVEIEP
jgi:anti-anti-sigma factor